MASTALTRENPVRLFRQTLTQPAFREQVRIALPSHISVDRFERVATTAVATNPDLLDPHKCDRRSLFAALIRAAQDGLLPDGREGAIVPFKGKAVWLPMVAGIMKKVRQSGEVSTWDAFAVFERDKFQRLLGDDMKIFHEPFEEGDPGAVVGAYSIVTFKDGSKSKDYLPRWRIDRALDQNPRGSDSLMRMKFFDEAAIKTVLKHHAKRLPQSTDIEAIFERDDAAISPPAAVALAAPASAPQRAPPTRLEAFEASIDADAAEAETQTVEGSAEFSRVLLNEAQVQVDEARDEDGVNRVVLAYHARLLPDDAAHLSRYARRQLAEFGDPLAATYEEADDGPVY